MASSRGLLIVLLLSAVSFAGCVGSEETPDEPMDPLADIAVDGGEDTLPLDDGSMPMPEWAVGDYWVFEATDGTQHTFVVSGETATDWIIDTTSERYAFVDAGLDDSSSLGPQRKSDLAGSEKEDRVVFFQWPLRDGATWTTPWDGEERTVTATKTGPTEFTMQAVSSDGSLYAEYKYDPQGRWFRTFDFFFPDGTPQITHKLVESGRGWTGEIVRFDVESVALETAHGDGALPVYASHTDFDLGEGQTDVFLMLFAGCETGTFNVVVRPQDPQASDGYQSESPACAKQEGFFGPIGTAAGPWSLAVTFAGDPATLFYFAQVFVRTRITMTVG